MGSSYIRVVFSAEARPHGGGRAFAFLPHASLARARFVRQNSCMSSPGPRRRATIDYLARRVLEGDRRVDDAISELVREGVLGPRDVGERLTELERPSADVPVAVTVRA